MRSQKQRDEFIVKMSREGVPLDVLRLVLRHGATLQRIAELECSSEAADRDRVPCPGLKVEADCICDMYGGEHNTLPRVTVQGKRLEERLCKILEPFKVVPIYQGDPRGCVVKLKVPSGTTDDWGREGICVPA